MSRARRRRRLIETQRFSERTNSLLLPSWDRRMFRVELDNKRIMHAPSGRVWPYTRGIWLPGLGVR